MKGDDVVEVPSEVVEGGENSSDARFNLFEESGVKRNN